MGVRGPGRDARHSQAPYRCRQPLLQHVSGVLAKVPARWADRAAAKCILVVSVRGVREHLSALTRTTTHRHRTDTPCSPYGTITARLPGRERPGRSGRRDGAFCCVHTTQQND
jgi:hypothetical protein